MKRIKDNIEHKEFKHLINYLQADTSIRASRKERLTQSFILLYLFGLRVNELTQFTHTMIKRLLEEKSIKVKLHKQDKERELYLFDDGVKLIRKYFLINNSNGLIFCSERGNKNESLSINSVIRDINSYLKEVFPYKNITSHSFRQTLITELAHHQVNTKVIQKMIGHADISTTYNYITVSKDSIKNALKLVR